jgi:hypothetical protein
VKNVKNMILLIFSVIILSACNSTQNLSIYNHASPDIFIECIVSEKINSYEIIENNNGKYMIVNINNNIVTILLKSNILTFDNNKVILISGINNKILKGLGINKKNNNIEKYIQLIDYIFDEINVYTFTGVDNTEIVKIHDKKYFLNKERINNRSLFNKYIYYSIRF